MKQIERKLKKEAKKRAKEKAKQIFGFNATRALNSEADYLSGHTLIHKIKEKTDGRGNIRAKILYEILIEHTTDRLYKKELENIEEEFYNKVMEK